LGWRVPLLQTLLRVLARAPHGLPRASCQHAELVRSVTDRGSDAEPASGLENAMRLAQCQRAIGDPIEHAVEIGDVKAPIGELREVLRLANPELESRVIVPPSDLDPRRRGIDADDAALSAAAPDRKSGEAAGAAADVEHTVAAADVQERYQLGAVRELGIA